MKIAVAQTKLSRGDKSINLSNHLSFVLFATSEEDSRIALFYSLTHHQQTSIPNEIPVLETPITLKIFSTHWNREDRMDSTISRELIDPKKTVETLKMFLN